MPTKYEIVFRANEIVCRSHEIVFTATVEGKPNAKMKCLNRMPVMRLPRNQYQHFPLIAGAANICFSLNYNHIQYRILSMVKL